MIVLDASSVLELLLRTPVGIRIEQHIFKPGESLHAPHLIDLEVAQVLRRYATSGEIENARAAQALADLEALPLSRHSHRLFLARIWELRRNLTAYDAAYVALAEALPATLLTQDRRLAKAPGSVAKIQVIR